MCCQSKKKPVGQEVNPQKAGNQSTLTNPIVPSTTTSRVGPYTSNYAAGSAVPKSTISFSAHDYDSTPLTNQSAFVSTKKVTHFVEDRGDRLEDYSYEINQAKDSKLLMPNTILK